eukprot:Colp12_sorted_trinity150504_noHs@13920
MSSEGASEEEVEEELAVLQVQKGYLAQRQGKGQDAMALYQHVLKKRGEDAGVAAVASNNMAALVGPADVFEAKKRLKAAGGDAVQHKLTNAQKAAMARNKAALAIHMGQTEQVEGELSGLQDAHSDVIRASALVKAKKLPAALALLKEAGGRHRDAQVQLSLAQLLQQSGNTEEAMQLLSSDAQLRVKPAVVGYVAGTYEKEGHSAKAIDALTEALAACEKSGFPYAPQLARALAALQLRGGQARQAAALYESLMKQKADDHEVLASLVVALSAFDPRKAEQHAAKLPLVSYEGVDVDALESSPAFAPRQRAPAKQDGGAAAVVLNKKKAKKKKIRLPKNYDPSVKPDPERWLPKYERSTFKKSKKGKNVNKGPQGTTTASMAATAGSGGTRSAGTAGGKGKQAEEAPGPAPAPQQQQQQSSKSKQSGNKKKKGKGKW